MHRKPTHTPQHAVQETGLHMYVHGNKHATREFVCLLKSRHSLNIIIIVEGELALACPAASLPMYIYTVLL